MDAGMTRRQLLLIALLTALTVFVYHRHYHPPPPAAEPGTTLPDRTMPASAQAPTVIVVGAGLAGLSASYSALRAGAAVRLLERAEKPGGNSIKASSGINGAPTRFQRGPDTSFRSDTVRSAGARLAGADGSEPAARFGRRERESLISRLTGSSAQAVDFLADEVGVDLGVVAQLGGHSFPRTHRGGGKLPPGAAIVTGLLDKLRQDPNFRLETGCEVSRILTLAGDRGTVTGVQYTREGSPHTLEGAVVFATGGFAGDTWGQLARYRPDLAGLPSTNDNRPGAHGILEDLGAHLVDMDSVQVHPTGFILPSDPQARVKFLAAEMLRGEGGILLHKGRRFVNEMDTRERVSHAVMSLPPAEPDGGGAEPPLTQWDIELLLDPGACDAASSHIGFYMWKGLVTKKKVKELDATARQTVREYSHIAAGRKKDPLGRATFGSWRLTGSDADDDEQEVCVGRVTPITHFTMGGAAINEDSQVLVPDGAGPGLKPVRGLWAAGEITGGLHGDNRLGGSSLLECVVFGRAAGQGAAAHVVRVGSGLD